MQNQRLMAAIFKTILEWDAGLDALEPITHPQIKAINLS